MLSRQELEQKGPIELAIMCQRVADNPSAYTTAVSDQALKLKLEWMSLQTSPDPDLEKQRAIEAKKEALNKRMAEFLAGIL